MLFKTTTTDLIKQQFIQEALSLNQERKLAASKRLDFYFDAHLNYLKNDLFNHYSEPERLIPAFVNVVKKVVDLLAMVYMEPPTRNVEGNERDKELWAQITQAAALDVKLKQASRLSKLLKTILLRPVWRDGRMDLDILTPDILDVRTGDTPEALEAVLITHQADQATEITYSLWTAETFKRLNYRGQVIEEEPNPYGVLPFVPVWDRLPTGGEFWAEGGDDLITLQEAINHTLTSLLYTARQQGFGVGWIRSSERGGAVTVSPGSMVDLGPEGQLGFEAPGAPIAEILELVDRLIKWAAVSNGLPASSLTTEPTEESGLSKLVSNVELQDKRRDDVALWARYERELFNIIRVVWNVHNPGRKISETAKLNIDFADPKPVTSDKEQAETWERLLDLGLVSLVDVAQEYNPDLKTREDAIVHLLKVADERALLAEKQL